MITSSKMERHILRLKHMRIELIGKLIRLEAMLGKVKAYIKTAKAKP